MSLTINIHYTGAGGAARRFAEEMESSGTADAIRAEEGNLAYRYYYPADDPETVLLVDRWRDQAALDAHHASPMMNRIAELRGKHDSHMTVERFVDAEDSVEDAQFIRE